MIQDIQTTNEEILIIAKKLGVLISKQKENYKNKKYTVYNETIIITIVAKK